jgi:hypothetical protein
VKKYTVHIIWLVIAIAALVGGFYYGKSTASAGRGGLGGIFASSTRGTFGGGRGGAGGGFVAGTITALGSGSVTVQLPNGNSEIVFYSSSTSIVIPSPASASQLTVGSNVMIGGSANSDGSVTASTIQVRGSSTVGFGGGFGPGGGNRSTSTGQ